jgi:endonuclease I/chitodextrinase
MIKKLFFFYVLLFISFVTFSQQAYYDNVDLTETGLDLKNALAAKITATHTNLLSYTPGIWEASKVTDVNPSNTAQVILIYGWEDGFDTDITNDKFRSKSLQDNGSNGAFVWNREHVFSKSLGNPNLGTMGPGADAHHLRPADRTRNTERSNLPFAEGSGNSTKVNSGNAWYPGDEWKGDIARMMMYMYVRYGDVCLPTTVGVGNSTSTPDAMIDLFLKWNIEDPVSDLERKRNTFHENTSNTYAQGNRNPFIDNPYLATRIWGGNNAQDLWGIYISGDSEAPSTPMNVVANNQTTTTIDLSWSASTDNVGVTGYNIYINGALKTQTNTTSKQLTNLTPGTSYAIEVEAKDQYNNKSTKSTSINSATIQDTTSPSIPTNLVASNISGTGFKLSWTASTDDTAVVGYDVFVNGVFNVSTTNLNQNITGLSISTTYAITLLAKDAKDNKSVQSSVINVSTTDGLSNSLTELLFSEYVEPNGGFNKALEIVNATNSIISLSGYSIKKQTNGSGDWGSGINLDSGSIKNINSKDVLVVINSAADANDLIDNASLTDSASTLNFNGNDAIGLFKNGVLIDIIGVFNSDVDYGKNKTLRRKATILFPNTTYDANEWESFPENTFNGIGFHSVTLALNDFDYSSFKMYPNPVSDTALFFTIDKEAKVNIYSVLGVLVKTKTISKSNNKINIASFAKGIYIVKVRTGNQFITKKIIKR